MRVELYASMSGEDITLTVYVWDGPKIAAHYVIEHCNKFVFACLGKMHVSRAVALVKALNPFATISVTFEKGAAKYLQAEGVMEEIQSAVPDGEKIAA